MFWSGYATDHLRRVFSPDEEGDGGFVATGAVIGISFLPHGKGRDRSSGRSAYACQCFQCGEVVEDDIAAVYPQQTLALKAGEHTAHRLHR